MNIPEYLTPNEVADAMKVTRRTVYKWLAAGILPSYRPAGRYRISREQLQEFLSKPASVRSPDPAPEPLPLDNVTKPQTPTPSANPLANRRNKQRRH